MTIETQPNTEATEATEATEPTEATADATDNTPDESEATEGEPGGREAARYRRRLREAEAERDSLTGRLEALQRAEVERVAAASLKVPSALWAAGVALTDVLTDTGDVDVDKVRTVAQDAASRLGLETPPSGLYVPSEGKNPAPPRNNGWGDAFAPTM